MNNMMQKDFVEFWGHFFQQISKAYGSTADTSQYFSNDFLKKFQDSLQEFFKPFDTVPRRDYEELQEKCQKLKEKLENQEASIHHLRQLLGQKAADPTAIIDHFQKILKLQELNFQKFTDAVNRTLQTSPTKKKERAKGPQKRKSRA